MSRLFFLVVGLTVLAAPAAALAQAPVAQTAIEDHGTFQVRRGIVYTVAGGAQLDLDAYLPKGEGPFPTVVVIHGGAWSIGTKAQLSRQARALADHGYAAFAISYRLAPIYRFPAQIDDCRAAVRYVREHAIEFKIDPERVAAMGYSAGGHLAALLGTTGDLDGADEASRVQCVVAGGAPCDFRLLPAAARTLAFWLGGTRQALPEQYVDASPAAFVSPGDPPMFFYHGAVDVLVALASPQAMVAALRTAEVEAELLVLPQAGHIDAMRNGAALAASLRFLDRHLRPGEGAEAVGGGE